MFNMDYHSFLKEVIPAGTHAGLVGWGYDWIDFMYKVAIVAVQENVVEKVTEK